MEISIIDLITVVSGKLLSGNLEKKATRFSSDTRTLLPGDFFVPLSGPNFDGHKFIESALNKGACGSFVQKGHALPEAPADFIFITVDDPLKALGDVANFWRRKLNKPLATISGSSGKTSTKNMMAEALKSNNINALVTEKNFNNLIGVPHTLLNLTSLHQMVVIETGMNEKGELERLTEITEPNFAVLTNIGTAHIGKFGSEGGLIEAKAEMVRALDSESVIIYNADCPKSKPVIDKYFKGRKRLTFAIDKKADISASGIIKSPISDGFTFELRIFDDSVRADLNMFGRFNIYNALAAAGALHCFGLNVRQIAEGFKLFIPADMRGQFADLGGIKVLLDCYNANPTSMIASAESFCETKCAGKRYMVMADMLELGEDEARFHRLIGEKLAALPFDGIIILGDRAKTTFETLKAYKRNAMWFESHEKAAEYLSAVIENGDMILFKGSRLMKLERIFDILKERIHALKGLSKEAR